MLDLRLSVLTSSITKTVIEEQLKYSVNYHPPVGRDLISAEVFWCTAYSLYKTAFGSRDIHGCLSLDSGIIPRILICACAS